MSVSINKEDDGWIEGEWGVGSGDAVANPPCLLINHDNRLINTKEAKE